MTHYSTEHVLGEADANGVRRGAQWLHQGDSCDNPASTSSLIWGPGIVTMMQTPDGGITVVPPPIER
jgi:hypothetical protein